MKPWILKIYFDDWQKNYRVLVLAERGSKVIAWEGEDRKSRLRIVVRNRSVHQMVP